MRTVDGDNRLGGDDAVYCSGFDPAAFSCAVARDSELVATGCRTYRCMSKRSICAVRPVEISTLSRTNCGSAPNYYKEPVLPSLALLGQEYLCNL